MNETTEKYNIMKQQLRNDLSALIQWNYLVLPFFYMSSRLRIGRLFPYNCDDIILVCMYFNMLFQIVVLVSSSDNFK